MHTVLLVDGHFEFFQVEVGDALLQDAHRQVVRQRFLIGKAGCGNRREPAEEHFVGLVALRDPAKRIVIQLVVVAVVAKPRGALGIEPQLGLELFVENCVLRGNALSNGFGFLGVKGVCCE